MFVWGQLVINHVAALAAPGWLEQLHGEGLNSMNLLICDAPRSQVKKEASGILFCISWEHVVVCLQPVVCSDAVNGNGALQKNCPFKIREKSGSNLFFSLG